ncbi:MAG: hypothetical protein JWR69_1849 [Pedosphaera sp.]|nr:hypothetical protein [Pedosphaera sp.]
MRERSEQVLRIACLVLGAFLLYQIAMLGVRKNPLENLSIPTLPSLPVEIAAQTSGKGTNSLPQADSASKGTNAGALPESVNKTTNSIATQTPAQKETNSVPAQDLTKQETNSVPPQPLGEKRTNSVPTLEAGTKGTNSAPRPAMAKNGMNPPPRLEPGKKGADLPPVIQARVERIIQSEILGAIVRPQPMALLGIAGSNVFLRAPSGQTGLLKEGEELGGVKLLRIGINRALVEQDGQPKELTIFSGFGSETLLPKQKEPLNETTTKSP